MKNLKYSALLLGVMANFAIASDGAPPMTREELSTSSASGTTSVGSAGQNTFAVPRGEQNNTYNTVTIVSASSGGGQASVVDRIDRSAPLIDYEEASQYDHHRKVVEAFEETSRTLKKAVKIIMDMNGHCKSLTNDLIKMYELVGKGQSLEDKEGYRQKAAQLKAAQKQRDKEIQELKPGCEKDRAARKELYQEIPSEQAGTNIPLRHTANNAAGKRKSNANKGQHKNYRGRIAVTLGAAGLAAFAFGMHKLVSPNTALVQW